MQRGVGILHRVYMSWHRPGPHCTKTYLQLVCSGSELKMDKILLLRELASVDALDEFRIFIVRVDVIRVDLVVFFFLTGGIRLFVLRSFRSDGCILHLTRPIHMRQTAMFPVANPGVGVIGTLVHVAFFAVRTLLAVAQSCEIPADRCARGHPNVSIRAFRVRAATPKEVQTSRGSVGRWLMGKVAINTCATISMQEFFANSDFVWIVDIETRRPFVAGTWSRNQYSFNDQRKIRNDKKK